MDPSADASSPTMTRAKVPAEKRQRTAQACDICKRRKQKCSGLRPCSGCQKRELACTYGVSDQDSGESPPKRVKTSPTSPRQSPEASTTPEPTPTINTLPDTKGRPAPDAPILSNRQELKLRPPREPAEFRAGDSLPFTQISLEKVKPPVELDLVPTTKLVPALDPEARSRHSTVSGPDEGADVYTEKRMLEDPRGRLLYLGDSASLSCLQLIRMVVANSAGESPFTSDPSRHKIMENTVRLPQEIRPPHILPDRATANILVASYFTNTHGLIEIFDRRAFEASVDNCYTDPLGADSAFLCLLYLVFAIGLVLATPVPGTLEDDAIKRLKSPLFDRAEAFFRSAKCLGDPVSGFEDADFWSVQALSLMSVYMLAISKRNAAYAYYGMAVRSAFALGLHRVSETMVLFGAEDQSVRRNLWRSLFVLDRFLAASLGRPTAISEDDCAVDALVTPGKTPGSGAAPSVDPHMTAGGLDAAVQSCQIIGNILKKVYSRRKATTRVAQEIAEECRRWSMNLPTELHWKRTVGPNAITPAQGIAILHVNLLHLHSLMLFSRPFFLALFVKDQNIKLGVGDPSPRFSSRMEKFAEICVLASDQTIMLVQIAYESRYLPQRNPFILYFLFAASLIILSNEFAGLYRNASYETTIANVISIVTYCAESDPQAIRLLFILRTFRDVVRTQIPSSHASMDRARALSSMAMSPGGTHDLFAGLFSPYESSVHGMNAPRRSSVSTSRRNSVMAPITTGPMPPPPGVLVKPENGFGGPGVSPVSTGGYSHTMSDGIAGRHQLDMDAPDSVGGEMEVDFDSFWSSALGEVPQLPTDTTPTSRYEPFSGFATGNGNVPTGVTTPNIPLYKKADYPE